MEAKRKVDFTTIESIPGCSKKTKLCNESFENYLKRYQLFEESSEYHFVNEIIGMFIQTLLDKILDLRVKLNDIEFIIEKFISSLDKLKETKIKFFKHSTFKELLKTFAGDIKKSKTFENALDHLNELTTELFRITQPSIERKTSIDNESVKKIKKLTKTIHELSERICEAENVDLSFDNMQNDTEYTKLPSLYKLMIKLWKKRECLRNQSDNPGRIMFMSFKYSGTSNQQVNKLVEDYFKKFLCSINNSEDNVINRSKSKNKTTNFQLFSIIDLKNFIMKKLSNSDIDFTLSDQLLEKIYKDLLLENKDRRLKQQFDAFKSMQYLTDLQPATLPDDKDPEFLKNIEENEKIGTETMQHIVEEYRKKDFELNGKQEQQEGKELGWDDNNENGDNASDEEESGEENDKETNEELELEDE